MFVTPLSVFYLFVFIQLLFVFSVVCLCKHQSYQEKFLPTQMHLASSDSETDSENRNYKDVIIIFVSNIKQRFTLVNKNLGNCVASQTC